MPTKAGWKPVSIHLWHIDYSAQVMEPQILQNPQSESPNKYQTKHTNINWSSTNLWKNSQSDISLVKQKKKKHNRLGHAGIMDFWALPVLVKSLFTCILKISKLVIQKITEIIQKEGREIRWLATVILNPQPLNTGSNATSLFCSMQGL